MQKNHPQIIRGSKLKAESSKLEAQSNPQIRIKDAKKYKSADSANFLGLENKLKKAKIKNH